MKIVGVILFLLVYVVFLAIAPAKQFLLHAYELAPEITFLVGAFYLYISLFSVFIAFGPDFRSKKSLYNLHVKMACSVMVSLGLVGTFLGLVDMISGIASALTTDEPDFSKKMQILLGAISGSLSAMSFAFITSILGVGISAYSMVASTFIASSVEKRHLNSAVSNSYKDDTHDRITIIENQLKSLDLTELEVKTSFLTMIQSIDLRFNELINVLEKVNNDSLLEQNKKLELILKALNENGVITKSINSNLLDVVEIRSLIEKNNQVQEDKKLSAINSIASDVECISTEVRDLSKQSIKNNNKLCEMDERISSMQIVFATYKNKLLKLFV